MCRARRGRTVDLVIAVNSLTKRFGTTLAVDSVSFEVKPGVVTGFLGPNGAGKSTTMRMILGLDNPTSGGATVNGRPYRELDAPMREVGALLDAKAIFGKRTARAHLRWLARAGGLPKTRVDDVIDMVGLSGVADKRVGGFSLGMSQRLGIAGALLGDPRVLMFDEPINGLDPEGIRWIRNLMRSLAGEGRTVLVSSHVMSEMAETAEHVLVIGRGRLVADMPIAEFTQGSARSHVRVVSPRAAELRDLLVHVSDANVARDDGRDGALMVTGIEAAAIGDMAAEAGLALHELTPVRASLEEAFMELTHDSVEYRAA
jgi:ABC-2 type transport system ATP-binding protein